jgi:rhodanese-related sulfurtransferase
MVPQVPPQEAARRLKGEPDQVLFLDVREPYERELATIAPSLHIPMGEVTARLSEIPRDRDLIVYCHGGSRSNMVAGFLSGQGWKSVANLSGGIDAWSVEVDSSVPRYG